MGLVALWRESLLAKKVLEGKTDRYKNHPRLDRFKHHMHPQKAIMAYLFEIWKESSRREFSFDKGKIEKRVRISKMPVSSEMIEEEFEWLSSKLKKRNPSKNEQLLSAEKIEHNPVFEIL